MRLKSSLSPEQELRELERATRRMQERENDDRLSVLWRAKWWLLAVALAAGGAAYGISRYAVSPTYSSSADVVVRVHTVSGGFSDSITASNNLASQYAQVADSPSVLGRASGSLPGGTRGLAAAISAGTVGDQNLVRVTALAGTPRLAQLRANAVANAFVVQINASNADAAAQLRSSVERQLNSSQQAISKAQAGVVAATKNALAARKSRAPVLSSVLAAREALLASLITQRQGIISDLAQASVETQPSVTVSALAGPGTQTQPKPVLYAGIAAVVTALAVGQILVLVRLRRRD
jgi:capsular polysaccharide biosynthesis protein